MMTSFWKKKRSSDYDFRRLIDTHSFDSSEPLVPATHIICDIDKTYLETRFESVMQMARIAFEEAAKKITVRGASEVLLAARWSGSKAPQPLHFVSSSPPQLRSVLEEKLALDGMDWDSDTFKNQIYNLRKGRMDLLKQHVAYKSAAILSLVKNAAPGSQFIFIGDNAESDALIYLGIKLLLERRLSPNGYRKYLEISGVQAEVASDFEQLIAKLPEVSVKAILIRSAPGYPNFDIRPLTDAIIRFTNFFEAALVLVSFDVIACEKLWPLVRAFHNRYGQSRGELIAHLERLKTMVGSNAAAGAGIDEIIGRLDAVGPRDHGASYHSSLGSQSLQNFEDMSEAGILESCGEWTLRLTKRPPL